MDQGNKLVQDHQVTDATVHDNQALEYLLDQKADEGDNRRTIYTDSAYRSKEIKANWLLIKSPARDEYDVQNGARGKLLR